MAELTADQAAVYDRQLRVWGHEVQKRLSSARVLVVGGKGLAHEVAKNLALAGVGNIALLCGTKCQDKCPGSFLVTADTDSTTTIAVAAARTLQEMNPFIKVIVENGDVPNITPEMLRRYDVVFFTDLSMSELKNLDAACVVTGTKLFAGTVRGLNSFVFSNLHKHTFTEKKEKPITAPQNANEQWAKEQPQTPEPMTWQYVAFPEALSVPSSCLNKRTHKLYQVLQVCSAFEEQHGRPPAAGDMQALHAIAQNLSEGGGPPVNAALLESWVCDPEDFPPLAAIVGGVVANHLIRTVSCVEAPFKNLFFYSVQDGMGIVEDMKA